MDHASIIYNPVARNAPRPTRLLYEAEEMRRFGWDVVVRTTEHPQHAVDLARQAAEDGAHVVFACGGDGTLNEVINGLVGTSATLGVLRGGTGDVFGKEAGIPRSLREALWVLKDGDERLFDLGIAGGRYFMLMAGVGFDGSVVREVPSRAKRLIGTTSYVLWGLAAALRFQPRMTSLVIDGEQRECNLYWLLIGNTRSYGGVLDITYRALADDGLLDAYVFAGRGLRWMLSTGGRILRRRQDGGPGVSYHMLRDLEVLTPGLDVQADGEHFGQTPMSFSVAPAALPVLLPPGPHRRMLSEPGAKQATSPPPSLSPESEKGSAKHTDEAPVE